MVNIPGAPVFPGSLDCHRSADLWLPGGCGSWCGSRTGVTGCAAAASEHLQLGQHDIYSSLVWNGLDISPIWVNTDLIMLPIQKRRKGERDDFEPFLNLVSSVSIDKHAYIYMHQALPPPPSPPIWDGSHILVPYEIFPLPPLWCGGGVALSPSPPVVWWGCGMVWWVCMVCMVGLVWHVWKVWYVWYVW